MAPLAGMSKAWVEASAALPLGLRLEGVTCTSTGLLPEQRSDRWRAIAAGPNGETVEADDDHAIGALIALARELRVLRGSISGREG
jgi:hypothetical protein